MTIPEKRRHSIRLKEFDYTMDARWFVTICTYGRECTLGEIVENEMQLSPFGQIVETCWLAIPDHFPNVILDEYAMMPNHMHGLLAIVGPPEPCRGVACNAPTESNNRFSLISPKPKSLSVIIRSFKSATTKRVNELRGTAGIPFWQRNYWEHGVRTDRELDRIRQYIRENPIMWLEDQENPFNLRP